MLMAPFIGSIAGESTDLNQSDSTDAQRATVQKIRGRFGITNAPVDKNGVITGIRDYLDNYIPLPMAGDDQLEWVYQFVDQNRDIFQLENPRQELSLRYSTTSRNGLVSFDFDQVVNGIKIRNGFLGMLIIPDSAIIKSMNCKIFPQARSVNTTPNITREQAIDIALSDTAHTGIPPEIYPNRANVGPDPQLIIQIRDDIPHLVWPVHVYVGGPTYYIDAHSGEVLDVINECIIERWGK